MPVPTLVSVWDDDLPVWFTRATSDADAGLRRLNGLKAGLTAIGWTNEDEGADWVIFSNTPLNDSKMFLRLESGESSDYASTITTSNTHRSIWLRSYPSLLDAQDGTNLIQQNIWQTSGFEGSGGSIRQSYFIVGDSRFFYFMVGSASNDTVSTINGTYTRFIFSTSQWAGELGRLDGLPPCSAIHGSNATDTSNEVNVGTRYGSDFPSGGAINPGINNSSAAGGMVGARCFSAGDGANSLVGVREGVNSVAPLVSPIFVRESGGTNSPRAVLPGIADTALGFNDPVSEGLLTQTINFPAGVASGVRVPILAEWTHTSASGAVYIDLGNDWDLYHGA